MIATSADIEAVVPLIRRKVTYRFRSAPEWIDRDDLVQEAMVAVYTAASRWDPAKGAFSTFAGHRAIGGVLDYLRDERPGTPKHPQDHPLSFDHEFAAPDGRPVFVADLFPVHDPESADDVLRERLYAEVDKLPEDTARVFRLYAEAEMTPTEISALEGVSRSCIDRRIADARRRMQPMARRIVGRQYCLDRAVLSPPGRNSLSQESTRSRGPRRHSDSATSRQTRRSRAVATRQIR